MLNDRDLPPCIVRILINLYTGNQVRILWAGLASDYFTASNGVKQGAVISPILFCIYVDDLLNRLKLSGVGCYIGLNFTGALAYADDLVLLSPTPSAMRKMLAICDAFADEYDILFNAGKSKFLVIAARKRRFLYNDMCASSFYIGGKLIENVNQYAHLGHIITSEFDDISDITHRRNSFVGQVNSVLCFFKKLDFIVKLKLFKSYCTSIYGCELWPLSNNGIEVFGIAWRRPKALRRILGLPYNAHSYFLPIISESLPIMDEICKRSARFVMTCLFSPSNLVRSVANYSVKFAGYNSPLGSNALFCCQRYGFDLELFRLHSVSLDNKFFLLIGIKIV